MAYRMLKAELHANGKAAAEELYQKRITSGSALRWDFRIGEDPAFCVLTVDIVTRLEHVMSRELSISSLWNEIPVGASRGYLQTLLLREIEATNGIEDIRSTRQEIDEALRAKRGDGGPYKRFRELARLYNGLAFESLGLPKKFADVRKIYDAVTDGELEDGAEIEGPLFRAETTNVMGGTKVIHKAVPAHEIEPRIQMILELLDEKETSGLITAVVTHFMFEYVHPFYDGNGRTGRFLLAQKLQRVLSPPTAIALSPTINEYKSRYYKAFETAENPLNRAELTGFVSDMLGLIATAQAEMLHDLTTRKYRFDGLKRRIESLPSGSKQEQRRAQILFLLGQVWLFDDTRVIAQDDVLPYFSASPRTLRKDIAHLEDEGLVQAVSQRPLRYTLTKKACSELGLTR